MSKEIESSIQQIYKVKETVKEISYKINSSEENNAMKIIITAVDEITRLINCIESINLVVKNQIDVTIINPNLKDIIEAMENEDYVLIGDLFEYEFLPLLDEIENKIENLKIIE